MSCRCSDEARPAPPRGFIWAKGSLVNVDHIAMVSTTRSGVSLLFADASAIDLASVTIYDVAADIAKAKAR